QNKEFLDHYLDVRCDLSNVLFIITANLLDTIPSPLRDRMDILRLSGYILEEKVEIANKYLIPKSRKEMGLKASEVSFTKDGVEGIINGYARESGVRSLEQNIKKILRKVAVKVVDAVENAEKKGGKKEGKEITVEIEETKISSKNLKEFLGKPIFISDRYYDKTPPGVCLGLAWTSLGGATLYIETTKMAGEKPKMMLTGQAGEVMKESSQIAWSYLQSSLERYAPGRAFFEKQEVHIHIPEGATPKDGPSAGITMVTALLSLLLNQPVKQNLGMTGELTLTGKVLPIGGVKEKLIAARRSGVKELIFPKENDRDYDELPDYLKKGLKTHFVSDYGQVFKIAFQSKGPIK
ncbi:MAG: endopeptidase La, partial [Chlamydiae bacterium]|nr:endopeptidase La [Chlamydiota bacterium]